MPAKPSQFVLESRRVRFQRFGKPRETALLLARMFASVAVAAGLTGAATMGPHSAELLVIALGILTWLVSFVALVSAVPLLVMLGWTGLGALVTRARRGSLRVGKSLVVERARAAWAFELADVVSVDARDPGWATVRMESGDVIRAEIDDAEQVTRLAAALAIGGRPGPWLSPLYPAEPPRTGPRRAAAVVTALAGCVVLALGQGGAALACFIGCVGLFLWLTALRLRPPRRRVALGSDGVAIRNDASARFVSYARIERVEPAEHGAVLVLAGGERVPLPVLPPSALVAGARAPGWIDLAFRRREHLLQRLSDELEGRETLTGEERLARQGRSLPAWREAVRALVEEDARGYRVPLLPAEQAARIVEAGRAPPEARIGAALALAGRADEGLRRRLRIAVEDCADEATRSALSEAIDGRLERWTLERVERAGKR